MKSKKQIEEKLKYLENSLKELKAEEIVEQSYILEEEIDYIEGRISLLKWVLG